MGVLRGAIHSALAARNERLSEEDEPPQCQAVDRGHMAEELHKKSKMHRCKKDAGHGRGGHPDPSKLHVCTCEHLWSS